MKRRTSLLVGIGLVLVGLLAGILVTLLWSDAAQPVPQFVRRVELNASPTSPGVSAGNGPADSIRPGAPGTQDAGTVDGLDALDGLFGRVAQEVRPAVVYIQVETGQQALSEGSFRNFDGGGDDDEDGDGNGQRRFFGPRRSVGSGVIVSRDGYIVTNNHVVEDARSIEVNLANKRRFDAEVIGTDPSTDLAVIKAEGAADLPALPIGNSDQVEVGEWVLAVGNPFRLTSTVTAGIVSALGRQVGIINDRFSIENFIQTDAAINPGNSGGALVNMRGELVGISTAIASKGGSYEGYGFAVPSNLVQRVTQDLIERGEVKRGFLGVSITGVTAQRARQLGLSEVTGAFVSNVKRGGAADEAGIRSGDVVLAVGERDVGAPNELQSAVARRRPGDTVQVQVWRNEQARTFSVTLLGRDAPAYRDWMNALQGENSGSPGGGPGGDAPDADATPQVFEVEGWGLGLRTLSAQERDAFEREDGTYVTYVSDGGTAESAGVPRDVVITSVDGTATPSVKATIEALRSAAAAGAPALLRVKRRDGTNAFYEVEAPR